jgi:hypothetical protein
MSKRRARVLELIAAVAVEMTAAVVAVVVMPLALLLVWKFY